MRFRHHLCLTGLLALATAAACKLDNPYEGALDIMAPVATSSSLAYVDQGRDQVIFVVPGAEQLEVAYQPLGDDRDVALWGKATADGSELLVMTVPASEKEEDVSERLYRFPADGGSDPVIYEITSPFSQASLSPDYRHAVLFGAEEQLTNNNLVAIVDLQGDSTRNLTFKGFGGRLTSVHFPGQTEPGEEAPIEIGDYERDIVAFLAEGEVVMVDMDDPGADPVAVNFGEASGFNPVDTLLRPGDDLFKNPVLFVRSSSGSDVAMLTLINKPDEITGNPGFTAQISLIPAGGGASDLLYYDDEEVPYLLTVDPHGRQLVFTDIRTHEGFEVPIDGNVSKVFLREHDTGDGIVQQAVAWAQGERFLYTLELGDIETTTGQIPERQKIQTGIQELVVLDNDRVLVGSGVTLYVVDLARDQVTPLTSQVPFDPKSSALEGDLLLLGTPGQFYVSSVDLLTFTPETMVLDDAIGSFHYLPGAQKVVAVHAEATGHVTAVPATEPSRSGSYVSWGFLLDDVFDRD